MDDFFTIRQVCKSCGLSRATLLRMEERGLLKPASIDPETGYRWYDVLNVCQVTQITLFLSMGMTYDDIALYYHSDGTSRELLSRVEEKYLHFKRAYEEIKLRLDQQEHLGFEVVDLPEYVCYTCRDRGTSSEDHYWTMHRLYREAVEKGYRPLISEPLFLVKERTDFIEGKFEDQEEDYVCCIPLEPDNAPEEAVVYPACRGLSCLAYGSYANVPEALNALGREVRARGLRPAGYVRVLGLVAPYVGRYISPDNFVTRLVVPIEG